MSCMSKPSARGHSSVPQNEGATAIRIDVGRMSGGGRGLAQEIDELEPTPGFSDGPLGKVKRNGDQIMVNVVWQEMKDTDHSYQPSRIPPGVSVIPSVDVGDVVLHLPPRNQNVPFYYIFPPIIFFLLPECLSRRVRCKRNKRIFMNLQGFIMSSTQAHAEGPNEKYIPPKSHCPYNLGPEQPSKRIQMLNQI